MKFSPVNAFGLFDASGKPKTENTSELEVAIIDCEKFISGTYESTNESEKYRCKGSECGWMGPKEDLKSNNCPKCDSQTEVVGEESLNEATNGLSTLIAQLNDYMEKHKDKIFCSLNLLFIF